MHDIFTIFIFGPMNPYHRYPCDITILVETADKECIRNCTGVVGTD